MGPQKTTFGVLFRPETRAFRPQCASAGWNGTASAPPEDMPEDMPGDMPEDMLGDMPEDMLGDSPGDIPETQEMFPGAVLGEIPGDIPGDTAGEDIAGHVVGDSLGAIPWDTPNTPRRPKRDGFGCSPSPCGGLRGTPSPGGGGGTWRAGLPSVPPLRRRTPSPVQGESGVGQFRPWSGV